MAKAIRKVSVFVAMLLIFVLPVLAQNTLTSLGLTSSTPATAAFSLRLLSSSYTGPLVRIQIGTSSFYDVYPDASSDKNISTSSPISGVLSTFDAATASASANALSTIITAGTTNATVVTWYDQSGNGNHAVRHVSGSQPTLISSGSISIKNSRPALSFSSGTILTKTLSSLSSTTNHSFSTVAAPTSTGNNGVIFALSDQAGGSQNSVIGVGYNAGTAWWFGGVSLDGEYSGGTSTTNLAIRTKVYTNSSTSPSNTVKGFFNGNSVLSRATTYSLTNRTLIIGQQLTSCCGPFTGSISEIVFFSSNLSDTQRETVENSQSVYFGITVTSNMKFNMLHPVVLK